MGRRRLGSVNTWSYDWLGVKFMQNGFSRNVGGYSFIFCVKPAQILLLSAPLNMSNPLIPLTAPTYASVARGIVALNRFVLEIFGLGRLSKVFNPVVISNTVYMIHSICGQRPIKDCPDKSVLRNVNTHEPAISISGGRYASKSVAFPLFVIVKKKIQAAVSYFKNPLSFIYNAWKIVFRHYGHEVCSKLNVVSGYDRKQKYAIGGESA